MKPISSYIKRLNQTLIFLLPYILCINSQISIPPLPSPPIIPQLLNFLDQRLAVVYPIIQTFKNSITSDPFNITGTWVGSDICNYTGFYCDHPPDNLSAIAVASIDFNGFQLAAPTLDGFIDQLIDLALFHANSNKFSGTISPKLAKLPYLYELDLSNNEFSGTFPSVILNMNGLSFLDIRYNSFSGSVPPQVFMQTLEVLFLNNNNFMQKLPQNLGSTPALYLTLANNKFTGSIPRSIGKASSTLMEVLLLNNYLTGCLPYEIGFLRKVQVFDVSNNLLTGLLPCSLGCMENIELLNLAGNLLYGQVPEVLCSVGRLVNLSFSGNYFTRVGPICRNLIKSGVLDVRKNCIRYLPDQRPAKECAAFFLRPRFCPFPSSYKLIPCSVAPGRGHRRPWKGNYVAYDALVRHKTATKD